MMLRMFETRNLGPGANRGVYPASPHRASGLSTLHSTSASFPRGACLREGVGREPRSRAAPNLSLSVKRIPSLDTHPNVRFSLSPPQMRKTGVKIYFFPLGDAPFMPDSMDLRPRCCLLCVFLSRLLRLPQGQTTEKPAQLEETQGRAARW